MCSDLGGNDFTGSLPDFSHWNVSCGDINLSGNNFTGSIPDSISTLTTLFGIFLNDNQLTGTIPSAIFNMRNLTYLYLANNHLTGGLPTAISQLENLEQIWLDNNKIEGPLPAGICSLPWLWRLLISNNSLYGPLPDCLFDKCITQIDVSGNSLYGRINRDFENIGADDSPLVNLAHNFFFGDGVLFAAGCKVCPTKINEPNNLGIRDSFAWQVFGGKCGSLALDNLVDERGKTARVSLSGNCLTLTPNNKCSSNATQRSTAACQAFCSITDNGPCDGHGACVPADPASPSNFTCLCDAGYTTVDSGNGSSTCAIVHSTTNTTTVSSLSTGAIVGIVLGCFAGFTLLAAVVAWLLWPRGPKKWEGLDVCEQFSLQQMLSATNNWSEDNVLGKGGFGVVYKGRSPQGQLWAIKRSTIMTNDFETEVRAMASLHHTHLVRLLGFCLDQNVETGKQEQILVYEFMANRDLEYHIHRTKRPLSLRQRLRLAQGAAEGLAYLHGFDTPIVHRDIKPANILVSADMQAKVADFGLLKRLTHGDADATRVAGTPGYVDPDYNRTSVITAKSDVFSFGIVLLQLLSGKSPHVDPKTHIRKWAMKLVEAYEVDELKDSKMPPVSEEAIVDFADLALDCIKSPGTRRPTMKDVAYRLSALIYKHCPDEEDEWENVVTEEGTSNQGMPSELSGDGGREPERSHGSQSGVISFTVLPRRNTRPLPASSPLLPSLLLPPSLTAGVTACCCALIPLSCLVSVRECCVGGGRKTNPASCFAHTLISSPSSLSSFCSLCSCCSRARLFCLVSVWDRRMGGTAAASNSKSCFMHAPFCSTCSPCSLCSFCSLARLSCLVSVRDRRIGGGTGAGYVTACSLAPCITPILSIPLVSGIAFGPNPSNPIPMLKLLSIPPLLPTLSPMLTTPLSSSKHISTRSNPIPTPNPIVFSQSSSSLLDSPLPGIFTIQAPPSSHSPSLTLTSLTPVSPATAYNSCSSSSSFLLLLSLSSCCSSSLSLASSSKTAT
ncbi:unnamed protein product [Closterium sp. NIES-53]